MGVSINMVLGWQNRATTFLTVFCPFFDVMVMFSYIVQLTYIPYYKKMPWREKKTSKYKFADRKYQLSKCFFLAFLWHFKCSICS